MRLAGSSRRCEKGGRPASRTTGKAKCTEGIAHGHNGPVATVPGEWFSPSTAGMTRGAATPSRHPSSDRVFVQAGDGTGRALSSGWGEAGTGCLAGREGHGGEHDRRRRTVTCRACCGGMWGADPFGPRVRTSPTHVHHSRKMDHPLTIAPDGTCPQEAINRARKFFLPTFVNAPRARPSR